MAIAHSSLLETDLEGISSGEALSLLQLTNPSEQERIRQRADAVNLYLNTNIATYTRNRTIRYTNLCDNQCLVCESCCPENQEELFLLQPREIVSLLHQTPDITEVHLEGGSHPDLTWEYFLNLVHEIHQVFPDLHIHAFCPQEINRMCELSGLSPAGVISALARAGLGALSGTSADIFDPEVRAVIAPGKISAERWMEIMSASHEVGLPAAATILFGHIETPAHIIDHLDRIRAVQRKTGQFSAFIPLLFVAERMVPQSPFSLDSVASWNRVRLLYAVARLYFGHWIPNLQTNWRKFGPDLAAELFHWGANHLCGTLYEANRCRAEKPTTSASLTEGEIQRLIHGAGRVPRQLDHSS